MPKRATCDKCHYPEKTCICDIISQYDNVSYPGEIHILQHPKEALHSKNSVRLLKLIMPGITLWQGESSADFNKLQQLAVKDDYPWACIFPSEQSQNIDTIEIPLKPGKLIFIDATWRKARKIWHLNPWLHTLPCWHLPESSQQQYHIRKSPEEYHLSTLEAVALTIHKECNSQPLLQAFEQFQQRFYQFAKHRI